jgi:cytochrome c peroxidase
VSCTQAPTLTGSPVKTALSLPVSSYQYNSPTGQSDQVVTLGRVLFYDTHLSANNSMACGSCHKQSIAFSDNVAISTGFQGFPGMRNTPPIQDVGTRDTVSPPSLFWDGRQKFLINMVLKPITSHIEMGMSDHNALVANVQAMPYYASLFQNAFGSSTVTLNGIAAAISAFAGSIVSNNTKFDLINFGQENFSPSEAQGFNLFFGKYNCNSCHQTQTITGGYQHGGGSPSDQGFINIGLDLNYADNGRGLITGNPADNGKFKIPNLRNVMLTAPYMHDGRFATLNDVLEHYSHGIVNHPNLDPRLRDAKGNTIQMNIPEQDKISIIAFLGTLTDNIMTTDPKFSNPFITQ